MRCSVRHALVVREGDRELRAVLRSEKHAVASVLDVVLGQASRSTSGVRSAHRSEDPGERSSELHGFLRCTADGGLVDRVPGVVAEEVWLSCPLCFCGCRGQLQVL